MQAQLAAPSSSPSAPESGGTPLKKRGQQEEEEACKKTLKQARSQQVSRPGSARPLPGGRGAAGRKRPGGRPREAVNFHNYRQTGVKSRPVKLLKHPIEHIERKIIITYVIGFLFKLIAILSGPLVVLLACVLVLPSILIRRSIWFLLNLSCLFDARIKTTEGGEEGDEDGKEEASNSSADDCAHEKSLNWNYCPLTYLETFWLKEKLVNNVILVIDQELEDRKLAGPFSIEKFRDLIREAILSKPAYRKFLARVVPRGLPFYKSYFWHHLGLATPIPVPADITRPDNFTCAQRPEGDELELSRDTTLSEFSISKSVCSQQDNNGREFVQVLLPAESEDSLVFEAERRPRAKMAKKKKKKKHKPDSDVKVYLSNHIYIDSYFVSSRAGSRNWSAQDERAQIRRYAYSLTEVNLDMTRPLWEIRVLPTRAGRRTYLIFRCHQSLADGHSLTAILTDHLTTRPAADDDDRKISGPSVLRPERRAGDSGTGSPEAPESGGSGGSDSKRAREEDEAKREHQEAMMERELRPIGEKKSFVSKVSKSNSYESSVLVGPLTVLLWVIWTFTRRKDNHLNKCRPPPEASRQRPTGNSRAVQDKNIEDETEDRRFYMTHYDLTKFHQIKQMTRSTVSDVILCALSGALRNYLRKFNGVSNPPTLNVSLTVNMRQEAPARRSTSTSGPAKCKPAHAAAAAGSGQVNQTMMAPEGAATTPPPPAEESQSSGVIMAPAARKAPAKGAQVNCTLVNVPLPTSVEGTVPRLWELRTTMDELRTSADPWVMLGLQKILFLLLPIGWYQWLINYIALRNSSIFVSNIRGPVNVVESWCVDLFQRAIYEAQQAPRKLPASDFPSSSSSAAAAAPSSCLQPDINSNLADNSANGAHSANSENNATDKFEPINGNNESRAIDKKMRNSSKLRLINKLGSLTAVYYCMQPPTSEIPISFNCITYHNKLFVTSLSRSLLVEDSKLLIKLFFAQLNQLADTIAKRKCFFTIIRTPIPIEISCQPASPVLEKSKNFPLSQGEEENSISCNEEEDEDEEHEEREDEEHDDDDDDYDNAQHNLARAAAETSSSGSEADEEIKLKEEELARMRVGEFDKRKFGQGVGKLPPPAPPPPLATTKLSFASAPTPSGRQTKTQFMKDDIEANLGPQTATKCSNCRKFVCTCRRRKSLFSLDTNQRSANLFSLLHPNYYIAARRTSKSCAGEPETQASSSTLSQLQPAGAGAECLCGKQLLEELDEDLEHDDNNDAGGSNDLLNRSIGDKELSRESVGSRTPSDDGRTSGRLVQRGASNVRAASCAKCTYNSARSLLSLTDNQPDVANQYDQFKQHSHHARQHSKNSTNRLYINRDQTGDSMNRSNSSLSSGGPSSRGAQSGPNSSAMNSNTRTGDKMTDKLMDSNKVSKCYSKSETDLLPMNTARSKSETKRTLSKEASTNASVNKESWFVIGRRGNRRISTIFAKTPFNSSFKVRRSAAGAGSSSPVSPSHQGRNRNLLETSLDLINTHMPSRRRQSVATTTGASSSVHKSIVVKDEINADVNLRYHLDGSILRTRRFSTIGSAVVGTQRRSSLIPFGLMNNQAFPKLLRDDGETHL